VRRRISDAAAIKVAFQREDDAVGIGIVAVGVDQTRLMQCFGRVAQLAQPCPKTTARRITDAHVIDDVGRVEPALL
jgi:hypothetical protein